MVSGGLAGGFALTGSGLVPLLGAALTELASRSTARAGFREMTTFSLLIFAPLKEKVWLPATGKPLPSSVAMRVVHPTTVFVVDLPHPAHLSINRPKGHLRLIGA